MPPTSESPGGATGELWSERRATLLPSTSVSMVDEYRLGCLHGTVEGGAVPEGEVVNLPDAVKGVELNQTPATGLFESRCKRCAMAGRIGSVVLTPDGAPLEPRSQQRGISGLAFAVAEDTVSQSRVVLVVGQLIAYRVGIGCREGVTGGGKQAYVGRARGRPGFGRNRTVRRSGMD